MKTGRTLIDPGGIGPGGCVLGQLARARRLERELVASSHAGIGNVRGELDARDTYNATPRVLRHVLDRGEIAVLARLDLQDPAHSNEPVLSELVRHRRTPAHRAADDLDPNGRQSSTLRIPDLPTQDV